MTLKNDKAGVLIACLSAIAILIVVTLIVIACNRGACLPNLRFAHPRRRRRRSSRASDIHMRNLPETRDPESQNDLYDQDEAFKEGDWGKYGHLHVGPHQKPTGVAMDIMNRMLMAMCLPAKTQWVDRERTVKHRAPFVEVDLKQHNSMTAPGQEYVGSDTRLSVDLGNIPMMSFHTPEQSAKGKQFLEIIKSAAPVKPADRTSSTSKNSTVEDKAQQIQQGNWSHVAMQEVQEYRADDVALDPMAVTFGSGKDMAALYR